MRATSILTRGAPKGGPKGENKMHETHPAAGRPPRRGEALPPLKSTRLLDQLRERIRALHYSLRTEEAYVYWCRAFIRFHRLRHPAEMGAAAGQARRARLHNAGTLQHTCAMLTHMPLPSCMSLMMRAAKTGDTGSSVFNWLIARARPARVLHTCRVPDDWLIGSRRGLLLAREVMLELKRCI